MTSRHYATWGGRGRNLGVDDETATHLWKDRQVAVTLEGIRSDHLHRYLHAQSMAVSPILDAACGVGYGAYILAESGHHVVAVDIEPRAIEFGKQYYGHGNIEWIAADLMDAPWGSQKFKTVLSFETIEHLKEPEKALGLFRASMEPEAKLICSVPNENVNPFKQHREHSIEKGDEKYPHQRHYTPMEFEELLRTSGFEVIHRGTQLQGAKHVTNGSGGRFMVYTCAKAGL